MQKMRVNWQMAEFGGVLPVMPPDDNPRLEPDRHPKAGLPQAVCGSWAARDAKHLSDMKQPGIVVQASRLRAGIVVQASRLHPTLAAGDPLAFECCSREGCTTTTNK